MEWENIKIGVYVASAMWTLFFFAGLIGARKAGESWPKSILWGLFGFLLMGE